MKKKVLIFDFFGVISSEVAPNWMKKYLSLEEMNKIRSTYNVELDLGEMTFNKFVNKLSEISDLSVDKIVEEWNDIARIDWSVIELIKRYSVEYRIALLSNANSAFLRNIIKRYNLEQYFEVILISSEEGLIKPDSRFFNLMLDKLNIIASEAIMIDDNNININAANNIGMYGIKFESSDQLEEKLKEIGI